MPQVKVKGTQVDTSQIAEVTYVDAARRTIENSQSVDYQLVLSDAHKLIALTGATPKTFTVPPNSTVAFPIGTTVSFTQDGTGQLTIAAGGGVTIKASGPLTLSGQYASASVVKIDTDTWRYVVGTAAPANSTVDIYTGGVDYTAGTTTQLTVSVTPATENNITVNFDGVTQQHDQYSLSGAVVTFTVAIPIGVAKVEIISGTTLSIGVPADNTVSTVKIVDSAVTQAKIDYSGYVHKKNVIINGNFDIWQRAVTFGGSQFTADRWRTFFSGSSVTTSRQAFTLGQTDVPNEPTYYMRGVVTSVAGAGNYSLFQQRIESVRSLAGKTATLSFYAKADASKNIAVEFEQHFGTGGSPSTAVTGIGVTTCALTTAWQKFTVTAAIPSISGKTLGTDNNDFLDVVFWFDAGSNFNARTNSLGQQSGTFDIAQVQLEAGSVATDFEYRSIGEELALCQRYFEKSYDLNVAPGTVTNQGAIRYFDSVAAGGTSLQFVVRKRGVSTIHIYSTLTGTDGYYTDVSSNVDYVANVIDISETNNKINFANHGVAGEHCMFHYTAEAEL